MYELVLSGQNGFTLLLCTKLNLLLQVNVIKPTESVYDEKVSLIKVYFTLNLETLNFIFFTTGKRIINFSSDPNCNEISELLIFLGGLFKLKVRNYLRII